VTTLCIFRVDGHLLAVDATRVAGVGDAGVLTPVPGAPQGVAGVVNLRGEIRTALDLRAWFAYPPASHQSAHLVLRDDRETVAVLVDQVCDVVEVASSLREPVPTTLNSEARSVVAGAYQLDDGLVLEIDARLLVDSVTGEDRTEKS
jgi:purine-binding chemotaxis protein CheW